MQEHNVAVLVLDGRIDTEALKRGHADYTLYVGSSNRQGGNLAGKLLSGCAKKTAKNSILLLNGVQGSEPATERRAGFLESVKASGIDFELTERAANWERREAQNAVDALLTLGKRFDLIFGANDLMALGAMEAIRQLNDKSYHPVVIGFDAIDEAKEAVKNGSMFATMAQNPYRIGAVAAQAVEQLLKGKLQLPKDNYISVEAVNGSQSCP